MNVYRIRKRDAKNEITNRQMKCKPKDGREGYFFYSNNNTGCFLAEQIPSGHCVESNNVTTQACSTLNSYTHHESIQPEMVLFFVFCVEANILHSFLECAPIVEMMASFASWLRGQESHLNDKSEQNKLLHNNIF